MNKRDNHIVGIIVGLLLPLLGLLVFSLAVTHKFDNVKHMIQHFQLYNMWYEILTLSIMPNVALFFLWNKKGKLNQARSILLMSLFYGVFVIILYF